MTNSLYLQKVRMQKSQVLFYGYRLIIQIANNVYSFTLNKPILCLDTWLQEKTGNHLYNEVADFSKQFCKNMVSIPTGLERK